MRVNIAAVILGVSLAIGNAGTGNASDRFGAFLSNKGPDYELNQTVEELQHALIWEGVYNGLSDGDYGPRTQAAVRAFQASIGVEPTGKLSPDNYRALISAAAQKRAAVGWTRFIHGQLDYEIGYPSKLLDQTELLANGGRRFFSDIETAELRVDVEPGATKEDLARYFEQLSQNSYGRSLAYRRQTEDWWVLIGTFEGKGFYTRAEAIEGGLIGYTFVWDSDEREKYETISIALADTFMAPQRLKEISEHDIVAESASSIDTKSDVSPAIETEEPGDAQVKTGVSASKGDRMLSAAEVYNLASPSVWTVVALEYDETQGKLAPVATGSAVAVTPNRLFTNCHTLEDASFYAIVRPKQGASDDTAQRALLVYEKPESDICVLRPSEGELSSFASLRPLEDLQIGERVFSIGSPSGYELTVADGLLSGIRRDAGVRYLQNSAPISPGSSGGGLFDAYGNLIGITTFTIRETQSLNFAISVDEFQDALD